METPEEKPPRPYRPSPAFLVFVVLVLLLSLAASAIGPSLYLGGPRRSNGKIASVEMSGIEGAIQTFFADYGYWPVSEATASLTNRDFTFGTVGTGARSVISNGFGREANNSEVMRILMAIAGNGRSPFDAASGHLRNPRNVVFLYAKFVGTTNSPGGVGPDDVYRDPWGNPYIITLDLNGDGQCDDCIYHVKGRISVWSFGPDGKASAGERPDVGVNKDNVVTAKP